MSDKLVIGAHNLTDLGRALVELAATAAERDAAQAVIAEVRAALDQYENDPGCPSMDVCLSAVAKAVGR